MLSFLQQLFIFLLQYHKKTQSVIEKPPSKVFIINVTMFVFVNML